MSEEWKKHDRRCPPCEHCGAELYEKFWGNGGWARTDKVTDRSHGDRDCIRRLQSELHQAREALDKCVAIARKAIVK
jgi:hypothetical protein